MSESKRDSPEYAATIQRLEQALEGERETSTKLRETLENLEQKVAQVQADFARRIEEVQARAQYAESRLADEKQRPNGPRTGGREESMQELSETRDELRRVAAERDRLQRDLMSVEAMQTETIALPEDEEYESSAATQDALQLIDELMASLNTTIDERGDTDESVDDQHEGEWGELISPELVAPEEFIRAQAERKAARALPRRRLLVSLAEPPIRYPLYKEVMTIGRSNVADIQIDGDFISRIHARIICTDAHTYIENAGSKNGIRLNAELVERHALEHGDIIALGMVRFTFVDVGGDRH